MTIRIEHLTYIVEIAKLHSISLAAKRLYIGQTTLSAIVKSMEEELNFQIFQRTYSGVVTTPEGEKMLELAKRIVALYNEMLQIECEVQALEEAVHILASTSANSNLSVFLTKKLQKHYPKLSLIFHEPLRTKMLAGMLEGTANIAIGHYEEDEYRQAEHIAGVNGIKIERLYCDSFFLCVDKCSKYAERSSVDISELYKEKQVAPHYYYSKETNSVFSQVFRHIPRMALFPSNELVKQAVLNSELIAFLTGINFIEDVNVTAGALRVIPLTGLPEKNEIGVYVLYRDNVLTENEWNALNIIREFFSEDGRWKWQKNRQ